MKIKLKSDGLNFRRRRSHIEKGKLLKLIILVSEILAVILLSYFVAYSFGYQVEVAGDSMESNISSSDTVLINRLIYHIRSPKRGDVIVFYPSGNSFGNYSIKRVIGVPGDELLVKDGLLYINGKQYKSNYITETIKDSGLLATSVTIPKGQYFVLGDNINSSEDSRFSSIGNVKKSEILGLVWWNTTFPHVGVVQ